VAVSYGLDHVHLNGPDVEATASFYERVFGMRRIRKFEANGITFVQLDLGGVRLTITSRTPRATGRGNAVDHFALYVPDLQEALADLRAKGVEMAAEPARLDMGSQAIDYAFIQAPDGVVVEILSPSTSG
jgi:catechol 2,3-dioxygenase-like lactoylglutathione lyase family enzyme